MKKMLLLVITLLCYTHNQAQTTFAAIQNIDPDTGDEPYEIAHGDLDNDGLTDLVMATYNYSSGIPVQDYIKWYKNDGNGSFSIQATVSSTIEWVDGLAVADLDGQHGDDIIVTSVSQNKLVCFFSDGLGGFGTEVVIDNALIGPGQVVTGDMNNDGHMDIVSVSYDDNKTVWYSNDGSGNFTMEADIENGSTDGPYYLDVVDFDSDGDLDVAVGFFDTRAIEIYYNQFIENGSTTVSWIKDAVSVTSGGAYLFAIGFADINNDGNQDVVKLDFSGGTVEWFAKIKDGASTPGMICDNTIISNPGAFFVADLDNDTFNDVIVSDGGVADDALIWFKGAGNAAPSTTPDLIVNNSYQMFDITVADFDGDGDNDIATIGNSSDTVDWFENELITLHSPAPSLDNIMLYPNPVTTILYLEGLQESADITVYNVIGQPVLNTTTTNRIDVSALNNGFYVLKINNQNLTYKFLKQ